jgi:hypothetical protein
VGSSVGLSLPSPGWDAYPELSGTAREQFKGSGSSHAGIFEPTNNAQMGSGEDRRRAVQSALAPRAGSRNRAAKRPRYRQSSLHHHFVPRKNESEFLTLGPAK